MPHKQPPAKAAVCNPSEVGTSTCDTDIARAGASARPGLEGSAKPSRTAVASVPLGSIERTVMTRATRGSNSGERPGFRETYSDDFPNVTGLLAETQSWSETHSLSPEIPASSRPGNVARD